MEISLRQEWKRPHRHMMSDGSCFCKLWPNLVNFARKCQDFSCFLARERGKKKRNLPRGEEFHASGKKCKYLRLRALGSRRHVPHSETKQQIETTQGVLLGNNLFPKELSTHLMRLASRGRSGGYFMQRQWGLLLSKCLYN